MAANTQHKGFCQPKDPQAKLWRYMDFTKYVSLLESSSLYFCRIDKLGDPFEGATTRATVEFRNSLLPTIASLVRQVLGPEAEKLLVEGGPALRRVAREYTFANCWHVSSHESAAMWRLYAKTDEAIAVQTTYQRLVDALPEKVMIGLVSYADYDDGTILDRGIFDLVMHKRLSFEHERELRALLPAMDLEAKSLPEMEALLKLAVGPDGNEDAKNESGRLVPIDLEATLEQIYVSPTSPDWYYELVSKLNIRLGIRVPVTRSRLSDQPIL